RRYACLRARCCGGHRDAGARRRERLRHERNDRPPSQSLCKRRPRRGARMSRKLTVLHTEASKGWGGQEIRILDESAGMRHRGHDVQIAAVGGTPLADAAKKRGISLHEMPIDRRSLKALSALRSVIKEIDPDVIVTHSSTDSWVTAAACLFRRRPAVVRVRHLGFQVAGGIVNRWLYGSVPAHVVTTGEATRNMLIDTLGLDPARVTSIPTGIDTERYKPGDRMQARAQTGL